MSAVGEKTSEPETSQKIAFDENLFVTSHQVT